LDKFATKHDKIFQLHLNNVATLPCKNIKFLTNWNGAMWMFAFKFEVCTKKCPCKNKTVRQTNSYFN